MSTPQNEAVYIPIPHYPPFKLRSSLIDKDPVIWVHLLEGYIRLMQFLLDVNSPKLTVKSQQQLQLFLKNFLLETSEEESKIFSLGAINPEIKTNTLTLKVYVFQVIKNYSFVKLSLTGEAIWKFARIYTEKNINVVRGLIDGSFKSKFNDNKKSGNISSISSVQKYLDTLIKNGSFTHEDLTCLSLLLGQNTTKTSTFAMGSNKTVNKKLNRSSTFAEGFVNTTWVENLEQSYVGGKSVNAETIKNVMVISIISLSTAKLAALCMGLGVNSVDTLQSSPLFSSIIISDAYRELIPNLEERLPFLRSLDEEDDDDYDDDFGYEENIEAISLLVDLLPGMTEKKARIILKQNNGDVEHVTNMLLENPSLIDQIEEQPKKKKKPVNVGNNYNDPRVLQSKKNQKFKLNQPSAALRKKTLSDALRVMYQSDEDEPDDTYDDQEKTTGEDL
ncbi:CUE domain-containing protein 3 [Candida viswanathii]|uniref:CUE domain-containing protein 3 n=1 Tax=Candida viswanathii TaxID=5486 RepID=A0A367YND5_9ASCO|nr:CUE domain-containing protein 3 [Candida viswanathii]